nr:glycosyltransferase [Marinobacter salexigens]
MEKRNKAIQPSQALLRVLHLTFNMGIGGTEQVIRQLVEGMRSEGIESEILCIDGHIGPIGEALQQSGILVHAIARKQGFDWSLIAAIRKRVREGCFDVVHCHQYTPWVYGWLGALGTSGKVVFTEHGRFYPDRYRYKAALINPVFALLTPAIVAISSATRDALARYEFIPKYKVRIIYNGISPLVSDEEAVRKLRKELGIPNGAYVVGTVSRLDPVKNQAMMLRTFKMLLEERPDSWLLIVGDGPSRPMLENMAEKLGIAHRTSFTGFVNAPVHHLAMMNIFLLSSFTEGTSMTLLEAMSLGIPTVATNVGGNPEILEDGGSGVLVPSDDAASFHQAILLLTTDEDSRKEKSKAATSAFRNRFSSEIMADQYATIYRSICN